MPSCARHTFPRTFGLVDMTVHHDQWNVLNQTWTFMPPPLVFFESRDISGLVSPDWHWSYSLGLPNSMGLRPCQTSSQLEECREAKSCEEVLWKLVEMSSPDAASRLEHHTGFSAG